MKLKTLSIIQSIIIVALGVALATCYHQKQEVYNDLSKTSQKLELATKLHTRQTKALRILSDNYPAVFKATFLELDEKEVQKDQSKLSDKQQLEKDLNKHAGASF